MTDQKKQPQPITMEPISHRSYFMGALDQPIFVEVRGVDGLGNLLQFIHNAKAEGFYDRGLTCFRLTVGLPMDGQAGNCPAVASLESVKKKDGRILARLHLLQIERWDGLIYTREGEEGGTA